MSSLKLAIAAYQQGKLTEVMSYIKTLSKDDENYSNALGLAIRVCEDQSDKDNLIRYLKLFSEVNPEHYESRIYLANLLSETQPVESFKAFNNALSIYQKLKPEQQNKEIFKNLGAVPTVATKVLQQELTQIVRNEKNEDTERFLKFVDCLFSPAAIYPYRNRADQQPSYLFYPEISQKPWYHKPEVNLPENLNIKEIQKETLELLNSHQRKPYFDSEQKIDHVLESVRKNSNWSAVKILDQNGWNIDLDSFPHLKSYINNLPLASCPPHAPEVVLSILEPGTHIPPHYGISNFKLATHLPIIVPEGDLSITVGGESVQWNEGLPIAFDDSFLHEAINNSNQTRVVLIADIWHPDLTIKEQQWITQSIALLDEWHKLPANSLFRYSLNY